MTRAAVLVALATVVVGCAGCGSSGGANTSHARNVRLTVRLGDRERSLQVARGSHVTVTFPSDPFGQWSPPTASRGGIVKLAVRQNPPGMTVEIDAVRAGSTTVRVRTVPSGDPVKPGSVPYPRWSLRLAVTG